MRKGDDMDMNWQEPFTIAKDQLDLKVYLLVSRQGMVNQKIQVEEIEL